jgi:hypothetical protein
MLFAIPSSITALLGLLGEACLYQVSVDAGQSSPASIPEDA